MARDGKIDNITGPARSLNFFCVLTIITYFRKFQKKTLISADFEIKYSNGKPKRVFKPDYMMDDLVE